MSKKTEKDDFVHFTYDDMVIIENSLNFASNELDEEFDDETKKAIKETIKKVSGLLSSIDNADTIH